jgi:hypothetical protein
VRLSALAVHSGRYRIVVSDRSRAANFHVPGPGANARTGVKHRGTKALRVRLARGTCRYGSTATAATAQASRSVCASASDARNRRGRRVAAAPSFAAVAKPYFLSLKNA